MRVVFLSRLFFPHIGGVERHVLEVSRELVKRGHEVTVITEKIGGERLPRSSQSLAMTENVDGIIVYRISVGGEDWFKKFRVWGEMLRLRKVILGADVVHAHDVFFWYLPFRLLYPHKKIFTTFHGYETVFPVSEKAKFVRKISEKLSFGNICVGDFIKKWYGTKADFVTYGGVSALNFFDSTQGKVLKIAFVGRLDADTGFIFYQQVLQLLQSKKISFQLDVYGDGELKKTAEKIGTVHGFVSDLEKEIRKADIIFASSYLSILEAMVQRKPVFSTYSNPLKKDYLTMTPFSKFIFIENDPGKMAEKIASRLQNKNEWKEKVDKAYNWASQHSWEQVTELYLKLWK
jgi:glycosyltransferase involved in cell wall biosynthesis